MQNRNLVQDIEVRKLFKMGLKIFKNGCGPLYIDISKTTETISTKLQYVNRPMKISEQNFTQVVFLGYVISLQKIIEIRPKLKKSDPGDYGRRFIEHIGEYVGYTITI